MQRIAREHPASFPLCLTLLAQLRFRDPRIFLILAFVASARSRTADIDARAGLAGKRNLLGQHVEVPEGHGGAQLAVDDIFVVVGGVGVVGEIFIFITFGISLVLALAKNPVRF